MKRLFVILGLCITLICGCQSAVSDKEENLQEKDAFVSVEVSEMLKNAQTAYDSGEYEKALKIFLDAERGDIKNMDARFGVVKCQIALKNYDAARRDLEFIYKLDPNQDRYYEESISLCKAENNMSNAATIVALAEKNGIKSFLEKVPKAPEFNLDGTKTYDSKQELTITADSDTTIYYSATNDDIKFRVKDYEYRSGISIFRGNTSVEAYCVKDGLPSKTVSVNLKCNYEPTVVAFADKNVEKRVRGELKIEEGDITDYDCEKIESLSLYPNNYDDPNKSLSLEDLRNMPNLRSLSIGNFDTVDCSPLEDCFIQHLYVRSCNLSSIEFVKDLSGLYQVDFSENNIEDISSLTQKKGLIAVRIEQNPCNDVSGLLKIDGIRELGFDDGDLDDYGKLKEVSTLVDLYISIDRDFDLSVLPENMSDLQYLGIEYNWSSINDREDSEERPRISGLSVLSGYRSLEYLGLTGLSDDRELEYLYGLSNLDNLRLYYSEVTKNNVAMDKLRSKLPNCDIHY